MDKESAEVFYVNITNSYRLRRDILEASKMVIEELQRYEKFKRFRAEKIKAMEELIIMMREINELAAQLKINMPKIKLPAVKKPTKKEMAAAVAVVPKRQFVHESDDELKKLESAIAQIEARLNEIK
jgi:hypothetical protein